MNFQSKEFDLLEEVVLKVPRMEQNYTSRKILVLRQTFTLLPPHRDQLKFYKIRLSSIKITGSTMDGRVRVENISFHKCVFLRYTLNHWLTSSDFSCSYFLQVDEETDEFSFSIHFGPLYLGQEIEFCLCYRLDNTEFWDNNQGANYQLVSERMVDSYLPDERVMYTRRASMEITPYW